MLEKLKKDYGVKVVATREYPGANLIINCEDYANQDYTICAKIPQFGPLATNNQESGTYSGRGEASTDSEENHQGSPQTEVAHERPQIPNETAGNYAENSAQHQPDTYTPRGSQASNADESSSYDDRRNDLSRDFGSRSAPSSSNESDGSREDCHDSPAHSEPNPNQEGSGERTESGSNNFDEASNSKNSHHYVRHN